MESALRQALIARAHETRERAHAPYSRFRVGAAVLAADGSIHAGCNVESASYGLTICAERAAVFAAVAAGVAGEGRPRLRGLAIVGEGPRPVPPCGACRQVVFEHIEPDAPVWLVEARSGAVRRTTARALLPDGFDGGFLAAPGGKRRRAGSASRVRRKGRPR